MAIEFLATFLAGLLPGCVPLLIGRSYGETAMRWMTGMAAGFLLTSALLVAVPEGVEMFFHELEMTSEEHHEEEHHEEEHHDRVSPWHVRALELSGPGLIVLVGFLFMMAIESLGIGHAIHEEHHHHERDHGHAHVHHPQGLTLTVAIGLTVHALTDGLAIGASLANGTVHISLPLLVGIIAHKMPAAFSLAVFGLHELGRRVIVWRYLVIFALATPVAMYVSFYALASFSELWVGVALLFSAGTFIYVATVDLLPNVHNPHTGRTVLWQILLAALVMTMLVLLLNYTWGVSHHPH